MPMLRNPAAAAMVTSSGGVVSSTVRCAREIGREVMLGSAHIYHASGTRVPPSAPELRRPRRGDRLLRPPLPALDPHDVGRAARARGAERRARALHARRRAAADFAAVRHLALRLARHRHQREPETYRARRDLTLLPLYTTDE